MTNIDWDTADGFLIDREDWLRLRLVEDPEYDTWAITLVLDEGYSFDDAARVAEQMRGRLRRVLDDLGERYDCGRPLGPQLAVPATSAGQDAPKHADVPSQRQGDDRTTDAARRRPKRKER